MSETPTAAMSGRPETRIGGRYRLEGLVGRGGSAEVWAAEDEALGRRVAVKLVTVSSGEDAGIVRDEARLLARLSHPGLVPVYDAGTDDLGRPWVVMELVEGETLADAVKRGALDPDRVAQVGRVLAQALAYVHGQGLVHRDVKPANVLLGRDGRVRLTDFGIARLVDAAKVTATGMTVGTASYLSPEQVTGGDVRAPTDVYALGLVLLECLTGSREYPGSSIEAALARLSRPPRIPPALPNGWAGLLGAMTAPTPGQRPSAATVEEELGRVVAGGEATTVLTGATGFAQPTQVLPMTSTLPAGERARREYAPPRPAPAPAPVLPASSGGSGWRWVLLLLAALAVLAVAGLVYTQQGGDSGRTPAPVDTTLPGELRNDLNRLQDQVQQ